ncbi:MAG: hypothetical protein WC770_01975 [Phycisphaerae bacterium]|jgi:hypothetical protein
MNTFSNDVDILRYEPSLFDDLYFANQILASGSDGVIAGTTFTAAGADFNAAQITAGMVIYLKSADGAIDGVYEIVSVGSATSLVISVLRADNASAPIALIDGSAITYRVCSYQPQSSEVFLHLAAYFDLRPGNPDSKYSVDDVLDVSVLRQAAVYKTLSIIYATLCGSDNDETKSFWEKSQYYTGLYEKALQRCKVSVDLGDDGQSDSVSSGASVKLTRG